MKIFQFLFAIFGLTVVNSSFNCLHTNNEGPQKNKACVFPFSFKNVTYYHCTKNHDTNSKPWCSTQVSSNGEHKANIDQWGQCDPGTNSYLTEKLDIFVLILSKNP